MHLLVPFSLLALATATPIAPRAASDTSNDLTSTSGNSSCKAMTVIFARGTTESGNVGTLAGPPFFTALDSAVGAENVAVQGVEYPANVQGFLAGGDATGGKTMVSLVQMAMTKCPNTKIVMAGYSQGGQLVHNAASAMSTAQTKAVSSGKLPNLQT